MTPSNRNHVKQIFASKTGVVLAPSASFRRPTRVLALLVAVLVCLLSLTAFAARLFSSLSGDDLSLSATYEGNGIVQIEIENRSDKELELQHNIKLMLWSTGEEILPLSNQIEFEHTNFAPHTRGIMTIDLSKAYDIEQLERPLVNDNYYVVLTNNQFTFGQDWMCTIWFADPEVSNPVPSPLAPASPDEAALQGISESLQAYFSEITFDIDQRRQLNADYVQAYTALLDAFDGTIVSSVSPLSLFVDVPEDVVFDSTLRPEEQRGLVGQHRYTSDANFKLLATETETALTISALLPSLHYPAADAGTYVPLLYLFIYEKDAVHVTQDHAFLYGQIISFADMEVDKVYEDEQYVCYNMTRLVYSDFDAYLERFLSQNPDIRYDEQVQERIENIYQYYQDHLSHLFFYR